MAAELVVPIRSEVDVVTARVRGRELAGEIGFAGSDLTVIATAISEVARNIMTYATSGEVVLQLANGHGRRGILVTATDQGPGITDVDLALQDGYSTTKSLGLGLPGARRLMDEFEIDTRVGHGTTVTMRKWLD
jgi:serine/threonine-protein kinase RsbT